MISKKIIVSNQPINDNSCVDCLKFQSTMEAIQYSFLSEENITLEFLDPEYFIKSEDISEFLKLPNLLKRENQYLFMVMGNRSENGCMFMIMLK